jgi:hypothetical protein
MAILTSFSALPARIPDRPGCGPSHRNPVPLGIADQHEEARKSLSKRRSDLQPEIIDLELREIRYVITAHRVLGSIS